MVIIIFKLSPRPLFQVLTGLSGLLFFNQNDVILVKKQQTQQVTTGFLTWSTGSSGYLRFCFFLFFF